MAKAARVHVRERHGTLFYDFLYQGMRCRENTGLRDNPDNRKRCLHEAQRIESEIALGEFEYLRRFPQGNQRHRFTAKPTGDMSFQEFALKVWLPHMQTKLSESTAPTNIAVSSPHGCFLLSALSPSSTFGLSIWIA